MTSAATKRRIAEAIENATTVLAKRAMSADYVRGQLVALAADVERAVRDEDATPVRDLWPEERRDSQRVTVRNPRAPRGTWPKR